MGKKKRIRCLFIGLVGLALVGFAVVAVEFILMRGDTPKIGGIQSIVSLEKIKLGGAPQWVLIRGYDSTKPVLFFLHGGPGMPAMFLAHACQSSLERDFVVVHLDRRGAGKSFNAALKGESLSVSRTLEDTYELARLLRERFSRSRIYLVGHSWGSYLGLLALRDHPEYYGAYVGMGQLAGTRAEVQEIRREFVSRAAKEAGDRELSARLVSRDKEVDSAHFPFFEEPDRFHREMVRLDQTVREFWAGR